MTTPTTALVVAGGRGTRLLPLTEHLPKPMLPFCGAPFLAGLCRRLADAGVRHVGLVVGADTAAFAPLIDLLAPHGLEVSIVPEPTPLDTAGGVRAATATLDEPVLVLNGDVLSDLDITALCEHHAASGAAATIALTRVEDTSTFGVCVLDGDRITAFVEKPAPGTLPGHDTVNAGAYVLAAGVLARFPAGSLSFEREVFPSLLEQGERLTGHVHEGVWTDLGTPERFLEGQRLVLGGAMPWPPLDELADLGALDGRPQHAGVRVGRDVRVARDARLDAPVVLGDGVSVGSGAAIGPWVVAAAGVRIGDGADVADSLLCEGAAVGQHAVVTDALLAPDVRVAPRARVTGPIGGPGPVDPPEEPGLDRAGQR
jgi:mannose-1-phosphate guanylyltransferase